MSVIDQFLAKGLRTRTPGLLIGPPGVGKSSSTVSWARKHQMKTWVVIASLREPTDFAGLPVVSRTDTIKIGNTEHAVVHFAPPKFAAEAYLEGGLIFLDEITTAPPAVQAALLRAVLELAFGDLELDPNKVAIVAAANPPELAAGGWDLAPPLANRFRHRQFPHEPMAWIDNFASYWGEAPKIGFGQLQLTELDWSKARAVVSGFMRTKPTLLLNVPKEESMRGTAWPSPRTWDFASRQLACAYADGSPPAEALPDIADCVGIGAATEFMTWCKEIDLPDPFALLNDPDSFRMPSRGDIAFTVLQAIAAAAVTDLTVAHWNSAWKILGAAAEQGGKDIGAAAAKTLAERYETKLPRPSKALAHYIPMLASAGLMRGAV